MAPYFFVDPGFVHCTDHAGHPLIAFDHANRKRQMPGTKPRMAEGFLVERRSAEPSGQKHEQLFARSGEVCGVLLADTVVFRDFIHQIVNTVYQAAHFLFAAENVVRHYRRCCEFAGHLIRSSQFGMH